MSPLALIKANPLLMCIIGAAMLALGIYVGYLQLALGTARGEVEVQKGEVARLIGITHQWDSVYKALNVKTAECNQSVIELEVKSKRAKLDSQKRLAKALADSAGLWKVLEGIEKRDPADMSCSDAVSAAKEDLNALH